MALKITNYLKNLGKSIQYAAADRMTEKYGAIKGTTDQATTAAKETANAIINYRQTFKKVQDAFIKSPVYEASNYALKNAREDIKSGKFWNNDRQFDDMGGDDDFDWNFDEDEFDNDGDSNSDITDGDIAVAKTVSGSAKASAGQISNTIIDAAKYNADVTKQTASFMFAQQERLFGNLNNSISNLHGTLGNVSGFLTNNVQTHIENSTKFFEESTKYQRENNAILKELLDMERERFKEWDTNRSNAKKNSDYNAKTNIADILDVNGVMDWEAYSKIFKKNFSNELDNLGLGIISKEMLMQAAQNPLSVIPNFLVDKLIGGSVDKAMTKLNKTLTGAIYQLNAGLLDGKNEGGFKEILANLFGVRVAKKNSIATDKYFKGQVPFDGVTRKSIVEVIPTYLSRIERLLGGEERLFNFDKGEFITRDKLKDDFKKSRENYKKSGTSDIRSAIENDINTYAKKKRLTDAQKRKLLKEVNIDEISDILWDNYGSFDKVLKHYDDNSVAGKFLRATANSRSSRTHGAIKLSASEVAYQKAQEERWLKSGISPYSSLFNKSGSHAGKSLLAEGNELIKSNADSMITNTKFDEQTSILKGMLSELFMIRTSNLRSGKRNIGRANRLSKMALPSYIDPKSISENNIKEFRANVALDADNKNTANNQSNETKEEEADINSLDFDNIDKVYSDKEEARKFDSVLKAEGIKNKAKSAGNNIWDIIRNPRIFVSEVIDTVDDNLYKLFFDYDTGEKDEEGNKIRGFFEKISFELKSTFNTVKDWVKKQVYEPIIKKGWNKFKEFAKDVGLDWFKDAKDGFLESANGALDSASNAINGAKSVSKENLGKLAQSFGLSGEVSDPKAEQAEKEAKRKAEEEQRKANARKIAQLGGLTLDENAYGSLSVPRTGITTISKGELIIPSDANPFNPDIDTANRRRDLYDERKVRSDFFDIMSHADGGNKLDGSNKSLSKSIKDRLPENIAKTIEGDNAGDIVGGLLQYAVGKLSGKVDDADPKTLAANTKATIGGAFNKGLDVLEDYSKDLDPEVAKSIGKDISNLRQNHAKIAGRAGFGAMLGGIGLSTILGPGGLMAGAGIGAAVSLVKQSDTAKNFLFGKEMEDGSRSGGLITRKQQALFKKYMPDLGKGAGAALIPAMMLGLGPFGAITLGSAYSLAKNNKTVNEKIFGKNYFDKDGKLIGKKGGLIPKGVQDYVKKSIPKIAGFGGAAALLDPIGLGLLVNFGLGAGLGLLGTSDTFKDMMLGKKDENGKRKGGMVGAIKNHFIKPIANFGRTLTQDFHSFMKYNLYDPMKMSGKILFQSIVNTGKDIKYSISNVLEKAFGGPFSLLIGKYISDNITKPIGKAIGKTFGGIFGLGKKIVGLPFAGIGAGLRGLNNRQNRSMIKSGKANHLTAAERLNIMGDADYDNKKRDMYLANSSAKDLGELEDSLRVLNSQFSIKGGEERKAVKNVEGKLKKYLDATSIGKIVKALHSDDVRSALSIAAEADLDDKSAKAVGKIINEGIKEIQIAKQRKKFSKEEIEAAKKRVDELGLNIDITDRSSLGYALSQVSKEKSKAEDAESLVSETSEKYVSEGEKEISDGVQTTNNLLTEIRDVLLKTQFGKFDDKFYTSEQGINDTASVTEFNSQVDDKSKNIMDSKLGHLKINGKDTSIFTGKDNKGVLESLSNLPADTVIDLDELAKLDAKTIERYSKLAVIMGPLAIKSIGAPKNLAKLTDSSFKSITVIAEFLSKKAKEAGGTFTFRNNLTDYAKMPEDKLKYIAYLISIGLDPDLHSSVADYAFENRYNLMNGAYTEEEYVQMLNAKNAGKLNKSVPYTSSILNTAKESSNASIAKSQNDEIKNGNSQRSINENGEEIYESTDGSKNKADTESEQDREKAEDEKDKKDSERQGGIISKALSKLGLGDKKEDEKEKPKGFLSSIVDGFKGMFSGGIGGLGTILGGGLLLTFLAPMLPAITKTLTDTVLPAITDVLTNYILPGLKDIVIASLPAMGDLVKSAVGSLWDLAWGQKEVSVNKTDENGNVILDENGNPQKETKTVDDENASWLSRGLGAAGLFIGGKKLFNVAKGGYNLYKKTTSLFKRGTSAVKSGFEFYKGYKQTKSIGEAYKMTKAASEGLKAADTANDLARAGKKSSGLLDASAKFFDKIKDTTSKTWNAIKSTGTGILDKGKDLVSGTMNFVKKGADKVYDILKGLLTKGLEKVSSLIPKLAEKGPAFLGKIADIILGALKNSGKLGKIVAKAGIFLGVTATGVGAIITGALTGLDLTYSIVRGRESWYNVAEVLADENVPDENVVFTSILSSVIDSILFSVLGPSTFFNILASIFGIDEALAPMKQRAQAALAQYNADHSTKIDNIADFNDEVVLNGEGGILNDAKKLFGFDTAKVATKYPGQNNGTGKTGPTAQSTNSNINMNSSTGQSNSNNGIFGSVSAKLSNMKNTIFGAGKFFKQTDPEFANIKFNNSDDTINQTIGDSGCGPTAGANALMALGTGVINPAEASQFALSGGYKGKDTGIAPSFFESYAASHGAVSYNTNASGTISALENGNPVVLQGESRNGQSSSHPFGSYPHYVTATGYDARTGKVTIQDPESNRDNIQYNISDVLKYTKTANAFGRGLFGRSREKLTQGIRLGRGGNENIPIIWKKLHDLGFGDVHAAAIMGNMAIESGFNPGIKQDGGGGFGLCQWDDRKDSLAQFASSKGKPADDLETQVEFIKYELQGSESGAASAFFAATDVDTATEVFCRQYERPDMSVANLEGRKAAAREILQNKGTGISTDLSKFNASGVAGVAKASGILSPIINTYKSIKSSLFGILGLDSGISGGPGGSSGSIPGLSPYSGGTAPGDPNSTLKGYNIDTGSPYYGFDNTYLEEWHSESGETNLKDVQPIVKAKMNGIAKEYYEKTKQKLIITGAAEHGPHAYGEYSHPTGWKIDLDSSTDTGTIVPILQKYNVAAGNEGSHLDLNFGSNGVGGDPITTRTEVQGASKFGRFGRAKDISRDPAFHPDNLNKGKSLEERDVVNEKAISKMVKYNAEKNLELFRSGKPSILGGMGSEGPANINQNQYIAPPLEVPAQSTTNNNDLVVQLLNNIYIELTKITGNTSGIGGLQTAQANTESRLNNVQSGLQASIGSLGNILNTKINEVSQNIQGQVNKVTKNVSGNTINQLQYLASK